MNISSIWRRIATWHRANAGPDFFRLAPGATEDELAAFEAQIGEPLPADVRASYALHNGACGSWLLHHGAFLPLDGIAIQLDNYRQLQEDEEGWAEAQPRALKGPVKPVWWTPRRFPVTDNSGNHVLIDLDPAPGGAVGQVVAFSHEKGPTAVLAPSFGAWLTGLADDLEAGKYVFDADANTVAPPGYYD